MELVNGPEHSDTLASRNNLAGSYRNLGRHEEVVEICEETLRIYERDLGPEHPLTLTSRSNVALSYADLGRYEEAVKINEET